MGALGGNGGATSATGGHSGGSAGGSKGAYDAGAAGGISGSGGAGAHDAGAADHLGADADAGVAPDDAGPPDAAAGDASAGGSLVISFPAGSSVAYQVDIAHTGNQSASTLTPPLTQSWAVDLGGPVSYPLIVDGRVFVTIGNSDTYGTKIEALDLATGNAIWGPIDVSGTYFWSNAAYDAGRVYVVNFDGLLTAFDASTGATVWAQQMPGQYAFSSPPTAAGGMVFVGGAGSGGTIYAVDGATGHVLWTASVLNGDNSSPALSADAVYVNYACVQDYAFAPLTGALLWHHSGGCEGGGGDTPVLYQGRLWSRDIPTGNLILDANTGNDIAAFSANSIPAFAGTRGFFLVGGALQALEIDTRSALWAFSPGVELRLIAAGGERPCVCRLIDGTDPRS